MEFETFLPRVQAELKKFNEVQTGKRNEYRRKLKEKEIQNGGDKVGANGTGVTGRADGEEDEEEEGGIDGSEERAKKRVRRESGVRLEASIGGSKNRVEVNGDDEQENILAEDGPDEEEDGDGDGTEEEDEEESSPDEGDAGGGEEMDSADLEERGRTESLSSGEEDEESE